MAVPVESSPKRPDLLATVAEKTKTLSEMFGRTSLLLNIPALSKKDTPKELPKPTEKDDVTLLREIEAMRRADEEHRMLDELDVLERLDEEVERINREAEERQKQQLLDQEAAQKKRKQESDNFRTPTVPRTTRKPAKGVGINCSPKSAASTSPIPTEDADNPANATEVTPLSDQTPPNPPAEQPIASVQQIEEVPPATLPASEATPQQSSQEQTQFHDLSTLETLPVPIDNTPIGSVTSAEENLPISCPNEEQQPVHTVEESSLPVLEETGADTLQKSQITVPTECAHNGHIVHAIIQDQLGVDHGDDVRHGELDVQPAVNEHTAKSDQTHSSDSTEQPPLEDAPHSSNPSQQPEVAQHEDPQESEHPQTNDIPQNTDSAPNTEPVAENVIHNDSQLECNGAAEAVSTDTVATPSDDTEAERERILLEMTEQRAAERKQRLEERKKKLEAYQQREREMESEWKHTMESLCVAVESSPQTTATAAELPNTAPPQATSPATSLPVSDTLPPPVHSMDDSAVRRKEAEERRKAAARARREQDERRRRERERDSASSPPQGVVTPLPAVTHKEDVIQRAKAALKRKQEAEERKRSGGANVQSDSAAVPFAETAAPDPEEVRRQQEERKRKKLEAIKREEEERRRRQREQQEWQKRFERRQKEDRAVAEFREKFGKHNIRYSAKYLAEKICDEDILRFMAAALDELVAEQSSQLLDAINEKNKLLEKKDSLQAMVAKLATMAPNATGSRTQPIGAASELPSGKHLLLLGLQALNPFGMFAPVWSYEPDRNRR